MQPVKDPLIDEEKRRKEASKAQPGDPAKKPEGVEKPKGFIESLVAPKQPDEMASSQALKPEAKASALFMAASIVEATSTMEASSEMTAPVEESVEMAKEELSSEPRTQGQEPEVETGAADLEQAEPEGGKEGKEGGLMDGLGGDLMGLVSGVGKAVGDGVGKDMSVDKDQKSEAPGSPFSLGGCPGQKAKGKPKATKEPKERDQKVPGMDRA